MERLLVLRLESAGVAAEAVLNGVPLVRSAGGAPAVTLPIHEYTLAGSNHLELVVAPGPPGQAAPRTPVVGDGASWASLRLLLPRVGQRAHPEFARTLAQIDWAAPRGEVAELPLSLVQKVDLPIGFPRWRWLDVPPLGDAAGAAGVAQVAALLPAAVRFLQGIALGLAKGDPEPFVAAARLRFEELAAAYQRPLAEEVARFRAHIQQAHAALPLAPALPSTSTLRLVPLAGGRLLDCLGPDGRPVLASPAAGGVQWRWPVRLAAIEGRLYVLR
jgi:hypothetical protein